MPIRPRALALAALAGVTLAACSGDDPFALRPSLAVSQSAFVVYPLNGSSASLPAGINLSRGLAVRPALFPGAGAAAAPNFDLAFDLDAQRRVVIYAPRWLAAPPNAMPRAGLQVVATPFDSLVEAVQGGYRYDSLLTVSPRQTVALETSGLSCAASRPLYGRLVVDSVVGQAIHLTVRVNPNCGFRSLVNGSNGLPTF